MKCLVVCDSFKGTLTSTKIGEIFKDELSKIHIDCDYIPVSDGGEGFCEAISYILKNKLYEIRCVDALKKPSIGHYVYDDISKILYVEMADICGIAKLNGNLDVFGSSSYGLGDVLKKTIKYHNPKKVYIGLGGTASVDMGCGMLEALGVNFYDYDNKPIHFIGNGKLPLISKIDSKALEEFKNIDFVVVNDVKITVFGEEGTILKYGKQKCNHNQNLIDVLDNCTKVFNVLKEHTKVEDDLGMGAAGGVAYAFKAFLNASELSGADLIFDLIKLETLAKKYDYVITGEGHFDSQTFQGKVVCGVINKVNNVVIICGGKDDCLNYDNVYSIVPNIASLEESLKNSEKCLRRLIRSIDLWRK